jgi:hypothetical protein
MAEQAEYDRRDDEACDEAKSPDFVSGWYHQDAAQYTANSGDTAVQQHQQR